MVVMSMKASNKICSVVQALGLLQYGHIMNMFQIIGNLLYPNMIHCMIEKKKTSKCLVTLSVNTSTKNLKFMASLSGG